MTNDKVCIGIDLGTTNSCIAYYNREIDSVEIITNNLGYRITPSVCLLQDDEFIVGQAALDIINNGMESYTKLISHVKRFIGLKQHQCIDILDNLEYEIIVDHLGYPLIPLEHNDGNIKNYRAEEISAQILSYIKQSAEQIINKKIVDIVITVPAYFNEAQRRATKDACTIAGLNCIRIIAEPTAACLCYGLHKNDNQIVLVVDIGGGTTDFSILELIDGTFQVLATNGDSQLGGADIDLLLCNYLKKNIKMILVLILKYNNRWQKI